MISARTGRKGRAGRPQHGGRRDNRPRRLRTSELPALSIGGVSRAGLLRPGAEGTVNGVVRWRMNPDALGETDGVASTFRLGGYEREYNGRLDAILLRSCAFEGDMGPIKIPGGWLAIDWTVQPSGGLRPWWFCWPCGRLALLLYACGSEYRCRRCLGLTYPSQQARPLVRAARDAEAKRARLQWWPWEELPVKPPRRSWRTWALEVRAAMVAADRAHLGQIRGIRSLSLAQLPYSLGTGRPMAPGVEDREDWRWWYGEVRRREREAMNRLLRKGAA